MSLSLPYRARSRQRCGPALCAVKARRGIHCGPLLAVALLLGMASAPAVDAAPRLFPDRDLLPGLRAGPRDPVTRSLLVHDTRAVADYGTGPSGAAALSVSAAVLRLAGTERTDALVVGLEAAAFARFAFQVVTRELVNTDWIFTVPVVQRFGPHWVRLRYFHTSSHLGDEYQRRFGPSSVNFSRDGADLTGWLEAAHGLGLYGLAFLSVNSHPEERPLWELRAGAEFDPDAGRRWGPLLTADLHLEETVDWEPRLTLQAGLWLPPVQGAPLRLALQAVTGPSPMGQFRRRTARSLGVGLCWRP